MSSQGQPRARLRSGYPLEILATALLQVNHLLCTICHLIVRLPVQSRECGHRFCQDCFTTYLREETSRPCPQCLLEDPQSAQMLTLEQVFVDKALQRESGRLAVKCVQTGCDWTGTLAHYEEHEVIHENKELRVATCSKCGKTRLEKFIQVHEGLCFDKGLTEGCCAIAGCGRRVQSKGLDTHKKVLLGEHVDRMNEAYVSLTRRFDQLTEMQKDVKIAVAEHQQSNEHPYENTQNLSSHNQGEISLVTAAFDKLGMLEAVNCVMKVEFKRCITEMQMLKVETVELKTKTERLQADVKDIEIKVSVKDITMAEHTMRIQSLETASYNGTLLWALENFAHMRQEAIMLKTNSIYSHVFFTSRTGYKLCARIYLNGDGAGKGTHISLFVVILKGNYDALLAWPFKQKVTLMVIDQGGNDHVVDAFQPDGKSTSFRRPMTDMNIASGCPQFMPLTYLDLPKRNYVKDDCMFIKVTVDM